MIFNRFSRRGLWTLFLVVAFPIHIWAFLMFFLDYAWIASRSNAWDALGVGAYGLFFALLESVVIFLCAILASFLLPGRWPESKRIALVGWLVWVTAFWGILGQLHFLVDPPVPGLIYSLLSGQAHPFRIVFVLWLIAALATILLPVYGVLRSDKFIQITGSIFERVSILMMLYLVLDIAGLVLIIVRNI